MYRNRSYTNYQLKTCFNILCRLTIYSVIATALTACNKEIRLPQLSPNDTVVAFGDSLTYGSGATDNQSYPNQLSELTGITIVNEGVPGEVTSQALKRLPGVLKEYQPKLVILCHGGNDMLRKLPESRTRENLQSMVRQIRAYGSEVLLIGVPKPTLFNLDTADFYRELAETLQVVIEDKVVAKVESDRSLKSDRIHPNAQGYRIIAERIKQLLRKHGAL